MQYKPAAAGSMGPRQFTVVAMVTLRAAAMHAVIYGIGIGETMHGIVCRGRRP